MKIMAVIPSLSHGGAERVLSLLSKEWEKEHRVKVVAFAGQRRAYHYGGNTVDLGLPNPDGWGAKLYTVCASIVALTRAIIRDRPDRIVSFMEPANLPVVVAAALVGVRDRVAVSVHHDPVLLPRLRQFMIPLFYRSPVTVISVSKGVKEGLISLSVPEECISTTHNPVELETTRKKLPRPFLARYILGVGRLHWDKGFDRLLRSFAMVRCQKTHLVILGDGPERNRLKSLACDLGIASSVTFMGAVSSVNEWYCHAECVAVSSRTEAWALVIIEAMANRCPVVSFACNYGPSEIIEHGHNGLLVPEGDLEGLSHNMSLLISRDDLRRRLTSAGLRTAAEYDVRRIAPLWLH